MVEISFDLSPFIHSGNMSIKGRRRVPVQVREQGHQGGLTMKDEAAHLSKPLVLYMLHCGLDGTILQRICRQHGLDICIHQFPREEQFAYQMHAKRKSPDLILIRGHFIPLVCDLDKERHIPYVVVSSKLKYGSGQPVFIHAEKGYKESYDTLALYHSIAEAIKRMVESRTPQERADSSGQQLNETE